MAVITLILFSIMILTFFSTFFYSYHSRRSQGDQQRVYRSLMNLSMGFLFLSLAAHLYTLPLTTWGNIASTFILIVGCINVYYGWKARRYVVKKA